MSTLDNDEPRFELVEDSDDSPPQSVDDEPSSDYGEE